jgi:heparin binding hemagglutinin HbhA
MTIVKDIRKTVTDTTPVYAVVGVTDLAVERLREARARATAARHDLSVSLMQEKAVKRFEKVSEQAQQLPTQFRDQTTEVAGKAKETYSELAVRGEKLVKRIRDQKSTQNLFAQAGNTVSLGKGAVTTVRKAAHDTQHAAMVTLATGRREAESVVDDVKATGHTVNKAAATTLDSADEVATTVKKSTAAAQRATRSVSTSARKTATSASAAAKTATPKVGD